MTENFTDEQKQEISETLKSAFQLAAENCGGKPRMLGALDISESWMHACIARAKLPINAALKLQILTKGQFTLKQLCPAEYEEINAVNEYLK